MKQQITLEILAEDISTNYYDYFNQETCAITKALNRAGINAKHEGVDICMRYTGEQVANHNTVGFPELSRKVLSMYKGEIPIYTFEKVLILDIPDKLSDSV